MSPGQDPVRPPSRDWSALEIVIKRFVSAWRQGSRPALDDYLSADGELRHPLLVELTHTELELRLKAGEAARAEEYLARYPELAADRAAAVELIAAEYDLRRRAEPWLSPEGYLQRFPHYRGELSARLAQATVPGWAPPREQPDPRGETPPEVAGYEILE
jgi:hypothetical protein